MENKDKLHDIRTFTDVRELIEWAGETYGERIAYSYRTGSLSSPILKKSFSQLRDDVRALGSEMLRMGCAGKHCAIVGKNTYEWVVVYFAAQSVGAILVPMDRDWPAADLAETAQSADVAFLFCEEELKEKAEAIASRCTLSAPTVYLLAKDEERSVTALIEAGRGTYAADPDAFANAPIDPHDLSLLVFTSGTTGKGKGVMLSQDAILQDLTSAIPYIDFAENTVGVLPPHHTYGSSVMFVGHAIIGSEIYLSAGLRYVQKELIEQKPGHLVLVPLYLETFYRKIMANIKEQGKEKLISRMIKLSNGLRKVGIDLRKTFFSAIGAAFGGRVKMVITGGAPVNPDIMDFFDAVGITILNGYGITECAPLIAVNRSRHVVKGSVGHPIDIDEVVIDEPNEDGEGEILVKGPNVMLGYYKNEEATEAAFKDGYFRTGDYGKMVDGVLTITGRKKNLIILSNGKNVYPEEIENELIATPGILDIIVYEGQSKRGLSHNAIVAEVYPDKEYFEKNGISDIEGFLKPYINAYNKTAVPYKKIAILKVRDTEFPKNTLRKIMRFKLDMTIE